MKGYRFGFNGKERDDEVKGSGNSLDFGARIYDSRLGRWLSTDPEEKNFPSFSPYVSFNNNPIFNVDENGRTGKAYLTKKINKKTGRPFLIIVTNVYLYRQGQEYKNCIMADLESKYNRNGNYFTYKKNGKVYDVKFKFKVVARDENTLEEDIKKAKIEDNFYIIDDNTNWPSKDSYTITAVPNNGGNIGAISTQDLGKEIGTFSHEVNHGYGGTDHSKLPTTNYCIEDCVDISIP